MNKVLNCILSFILIFTAFPFNAFAQSTVKSKEYYLKQADAALRQKMEQQMVLPFTRNVPRPQVVSLPPSAEKAFILRNSVMSLFMPAFSSSEAEQSTPFTYKEFKQEVKKILAEKKISAANVSEAVIKKDYNAYIKKYNAQEATYQKEALALLKNNMQALMALYKKNPSATAVYVAETANFVWGYKDVLTDAQRQDILTLYRKALTKPLKCEKTCPLQLNSVMGLAQAGDRYDGTAIYHFIEANLTNQNTPQILLSGISALLVLERYDLVGSVLENATAEEKVLNSSDIDMLSVLFYVNALGVVRGQYYGKISGFAKYDDGKIQGNAWADVAAMLAEDGSAQSLALLKKYGVDKCRVMREMKIDSSYGYKISCGAIQPFLAGALLSGKSGAQNYEAEHLNHVGAVIGVPGNTYLPSEKEVNYSISLSKGSGANLAAFAKEAGLSKDAVFAANMMNAGMGDMSAKEEYALDKALYSKYHALSNIKGKYAVVDGSSLSAKQSRQETLKTAKKVAIAADVAIIALAAYSIGKMAVSAAKGFGSLGREVYQGMKLSRLGNSAAISAEVSKNMSAYKFIIKNRMARQNAFTNIAKTFQSFKTSAAGGEVGSALMFKDAPKIPKIKPAAQVNAKPQTLQFDYQLLKKGELPSVLGEQTVYAEAVGGGSSGASAASAQKETLSRVASAWRRKQNLAQNKAIAREAKEMMLPYRTEQAQRASLYSSRNWIDKKIYGDKFYSELSAPKQKLLNFQADLSYGANIAKSILKYGTTNPKTYASLILPVSTTSQVSVAQIITVAAQPSTAFMAGEALSSANTAAELANVTSSVKSLGVAASAENGFAKIASLPLIIGNRPQDRFVSAKVLNAAERTMSTAQYIASALNPFNEVRFNGESVRLSAADINLSVSNDVAEQHFKTVVINILNAMQNEQQASSAAAVFIFPMPKSLTDRLMGQSANFSKTEAGRAQTALDYAYMTASQLYSKTEQGSEKLKDGSALKDPVFTDLLMSEAERNLKAVKKLDLASRKRILAALKVVFATSDEKSTSYEQKIAAARAEFEQLKTLPDSQDKANKLKAAFDKLRALNSIIFKDADNADIRAKLPDNPQLLMFSMAAAMQQVNATVEAEARNAKKAANAKAAAYTLSKNQALQSDFKTEEWIGTISQGVSAVNEYLKKLNDFKAKLDELALTENAAKKQSSAAAVHKEIIAFDRKVTEGPNRNMLTDIYFNKTKGLIKEAYLMSKGLQPEDIAPFVITPKVLEPEVKEPVLVQNKAPVKRAAKKETKVAAPVVPPVAPVRRKTEAEEPRFSMLDKIILKQNEIAAKKQKKSTLAKENSIAATLEDISNRVDELDINEDYVDLLASKHDFDELFYLSSTLEALLEEVHAAANQIQQENIQVLFDPTEELEDKINHYIGILSAAENIQGKRMDNEYAAAASRPEKFMTNKNIPYIDFPQMSEAVISGMETMPDEQRKEKKDALYNFVSTYKRLPNPKVMLEADLFNTYKSLSPYSAPDRKLLALTRKIADDIGNTRYDRLLLLKDLTTGPSKISYAELSVSNRGLFHIMSSITDEANTDISIQAIEQIAFIRENINNYTVSNIDTKSDKLDFTPAVNNMQDARVWLNFVLANKAKVMSLKDELAKGMIFRDINRKAVRIINLNNDAEDDQKLSDSAFASLIDLEEISDEYTIYSVVISQPLLQEGSLQDLLVNAGLMYAVGYNKHMGEDKLRAAALEALSNGIFMTSEQEALLESIADNSSNSGKLLSNLNEFLEEHGFWPREDSYDVAEKELARQLDNVKDDKNDENYSKILDLRKQMQPKKRAASVVKEEPLALPKAEESKAIQVEEVPALNPALEEQPVEINKDLNKKTQEENIVVKMISKLKGLFGKK